MSFRPLETNWSPYLWWINWHPAGTLIPAGTVDNPSLITLNDLSWQSQFSFCGHTGGVNAAIWHPRGGRLVTAAWDGTVRLWEPGNLHHRKIRLSANSIESAFWHHAGSAIAAVTHDGWVHLLDARLKPVARYRVDGPLYHGCFSGRGAYLFAGGSQGLFRIEVASAETFHLPVPGGVIAVSCTTGGNKLYAATGEGAVIGISVPAPRPVTVYSHAAAGRGIALSAGGRLAAGFADGSLVILDQTGKVRETLNLGFEVTALAWRPQGDRLFIGTRGGPAGFAAG